MTTNMQTGPKASINKECILIISLLTGFFILLEISFFIQCNQAYLEDFTFVSERLTIPSSILISLGYFLGAQFLLHLGYIVITWCSVRVLLFYFPFISVLKMSLLTWSGGIFAILIANQYYYPNSKFAILSSALISNPTYLQWLYYLILTGCGLLFLLTVYYTFNLLKSYAKYLLSLGLALVMLKGAYQLCFPKPQAITIFKTPNIILIGIDSLRPDFLTLFGGEAKTPFLNSFLTQAVVFTDAITPLARTFPSWSTILTGQYPKATHIRSNLAPYNKENVSNALPNILKQAGYDTIYATDETRFSNLDQRFGFDQVISPPMGIADFLIGTFNDFPFSNLIINTGLGKWLFPYSYANRAVYHTYNPDSFLNLIQTSLIDRKNKPLFLSVHFCLVHYPYVWSNLSLAGTTPWQRYQASIERVDQQIKQFFTFLKQIKVLDDALVIVLSDHGEALELAGDRITSAEAFVPATHKAPLFYPPSLDDEAINQSAGHGTDVLGLPQYHTLLAFQIMKQKKSSLDKIVTGVVSLLDVKATILDYLHLAAMDTKADGSSLLKYFNKQSTLTIPAKHLFLESDYSPAALRTVYPETKKVLLEGVDLFQIDSKSLRLTVKKKMGEMIINSKQFADIYGEWMLALYPQTHCRRIPILINLRSGVWTNDLHSQFAQQSPAKEMFKALQQFYGQELETF